MLCAWHYISHYRHGCSPTSTKWTSERTSILRILQLLPSSLGVVLLPSSLDLLPFLCPYYMNLVWKDILPFSSLLTPRGNSSNSSRLRFFSDGFFPNCVFFNLFTYLHTQLHLLLHNIVRSLIIPYLHCTNYLISLNDSSVLLGNDHQSSQQVYLLQ